MLLILLIINKLALAKLPTGLASVITSWGLLYPNFPNPSLSCLARNKG
jgi:hypothetical protein